MTVATCPEDDTLRAVLSGDLSLPTAAHVLNHLKSCNACVQRADELQLSDSLTLAIRKVNEQSPAIDSQEQALVETIISRAKHLASETQNGLAPTLDGETSEDGGSFETDAIQAQSELDFLSPAKAPDELGRLGDFRILEVLGRGGMGIVFRAEDTTLDRVVALKVMIPGMRLTDSLRLRFLREAKAMAAVDHENVIQVFRVGESDGVPYVAMKCLEGQSLSDRMASLQPIDDSELTRIGLETARGLAAVHACGLIHRDLKPDNLWLEKNGRVKILDFGLAAADDSQDLTRAGALLGTPTYMSPEQANSEELDPRSDLFSLGSLLYRAATGNPAFRGNGLTAILIAVAKCEFDPIEKRCPEVDRELAAVIERLMAADPSKRYQSATDAEQAFDAIAKRLSQQTFASPPEVNAPLPKVNPQKRLPRTAFLIALACVGAIILATVLIQIRLGNGKVEIALDDPDNVVSVDIRSKDEIAIEDPIDGKPVLIRVDHKTHQLQVEKQGFRVVTKQFDLTDEQGRKINVRFVPKGQRSESVHVVPDTKSSLPVDDSQREVIRWVLSNGGRTGVQSGILDSVDQMTDAPIDEVSIWMWPECNDEDVARLAAIKKLTLLVLDGTKITGACFDTLANSPSETPFVLNVFGCQNLQAKNLQALPDQPIAGFHAGEAKLGDASVRTVCSIDSLTSITCGVETTGQSVAFLAQHPRLVEISFVDCLKLKPVDFEAIKQTAELHLLKIDVAHAQSETYRHLKPIASLQSLVIDTNAPTGKEMSFAGLSALSQLRSLSIGHLEQELTSQEIDELLKMDALESLDFHWMPGGEQTLRLLSEGLPNCSVRYNGELFAESAP